MGKKHNIFGDWMTGVSTAIGNSFIGSTELLLHHQLQLWQQPTPVRCAWWWWMRGSDWVSFRRNTNMTTYELALACGKETRFGVCASVLGAHTSCWLRRTLAAQC